MKHIDKKLMGGLALVVLALALIPALVEATPNPNSAVIRTRIFNDCPSSILTYSNNYPSEIWIDDADLECYGYANLHNWRFSEDGSTPVVFDNDSNFNFCADLVITGTTTAESGLQVSPWWSQDVDGRFNVRIPDGEIACFGGRLPFYSFTGQYGLSYVAGTLIHLEITYHPNGLSEQDPATIEYELDYNSAHYTSGPLPFDMGNPSEDPPYGLWGMLNDGRVGGHFQAVLIGGDPAAQARATWTNICYTNLDHPVPVEETTWGSVKNKYR